MEQQRANLSNPALGTGPATVAIPALLEQLLHRENQRTATASLLGAVAESLDSLGVALCLFDEADNVCLWNPSLTRLFPEHAGHMVIGEGYRRMLRRFYETRLSAHELPAIERHIDEAVARHQAQQRPFHFEHNGLRISVASLPVPGVGRIRIWQQQPPQGTAPAGPPSLAMDELPPIDGAALFDQVADGVMVSGVDHRIVWVNSAFVAMYGLGRRSAAFGLSFEDAFHTAWRAVPLAQRAPFDQGLAILADQLRFAGAPFELPLPGARWTRVIAQRSADGRCFFMHVDITMLKRQQQQLLEAERRARESEQVLQEKSALLEATLERMEQGVMMVNADRVVEVCNRRARELLDLPQTLMDSRPTLDVLAEYQTAHGEFDNAPPELVARVKAGGIFCQAYAYDRKRPNGRVIEVSSVPTESGGVLRTYTDITERKRAEERIRHVARHDGLTSLVNREVFLEYLSAAINDPVRRAEGFAVHFIDIDRFKPINDRCGHAIGDKVLALLAQRMRLVARDVDVVARMGGDEFAVLQYHVDQADGARGLANRLRDGVASPMEIETHRLRVGASVGIALYQASDVEAELAGTGHRLQTADALLRHADTAMYAAKGTDGVRIFGVDGVDSHWAPIRP